MIRGRVRHLVDIAALIAISMLVFGGAAHRLSHSDGSAGTDATASLHHTTTCSADGDASHPAPADPHDHNPSEHHECPFCLLHSAGALASAMSPDDALRLDVCERAPDVGASRIPCAVYRRQSAPRAPPAC